MQVTLKSPPSLGKSSEMEVSSVFELWQNGSAWLPPASPDKEMLTVGEHMQ